MVDRARLAGLTTLGGLVPDFFNYGPLSDHFLGLGDADQAPDVEDHTVILICECGNLGCNDLFVRIRTAPEFVRWEDFRAEDGSLSLPDLGPFEFDRREYEACLAALAP